jgi:hypothetical protein
VVVTREVFGWHEFPSLSAQYLVKIHIWPKTASIHV